MFLLNLLRVTKIILSNIFNVESAIGHAKGIATRRNGDKIKCTGNNIIDFIKQCYGD